MNRIIVALLLIAFYSIGCGGSSNSSTTGNLGSDQSSQEDGFVPSYSTDFKISGTNGTESEYLTDSIGTDSLLKVKVFAGPAGVLTSPTNSSASMAYGCVSYKVTLYSVIDGTLVQNGQSHQTQMLAVESGNTWLCPNAPESEVIDFTDRLSGPYPFVIRISDARYDFYCQLYWWAMQNGQNPYYAAGPYNSVCPSKTVYATHTVTGSLGIQTNGAGI